MKIHFRRHDIFFIFPSAERLKPYKNRDWFSDCILVCLFSIDNYLTGNIFPSVYFSFFNSIYAFLFSRPSYIIFVNRTSLINLLFCFIASFFLSFLLSVYAYHHWMSMFMFSWEFNISYASFISRSCTNAFSSYVSADGIVPSRNMAQIFWWHDIYINIYI